MRAEDQDHDGWGADGGGREHVVVVVVVVEAEARLGHEAMSV